MCVFDFIMPAHTHSYQELGYVYMALYPVFFLSSPGGKTGFLKTGILPQSSFWNWDRPMHEHMHKCKNRILKKPDQNWDTQVNVNTQSLDPFPQVTVGTKVYPFFPISYYTEGKKYSTTYHRTGNTPLHHYCLHPRPGRVACKPESLQGHQEKPQRGTEQEPCSTLGRCRSHLSQSTPLWPSTTPHLEWKQKEKSLTGFIFSCQTRGGQVLAQMSCLIEVLDII